MNTQLKEAFIKLLSYDDQITTLLLEENLEIIRIINPAVELCELKHDNCPTLEDYILDNAVFKALYDLFTDTDKAFIIIRANL